MRPASHQADEHPASFCVKRAPHVTEGLGPYAGLGPQESDEKSAGKLTTMKLNKMEKRRGQARGKDRAVSLYNQSTQARSLEGEQVRNGNKKTWSDHAETF